MPTAVILTAIRVEYIAVRSHLTNIQEVMHPQGTIYEKGKFSSDNQTWDVVIVETGAGNSPAGIEAERAIAHFKPRVVLFVGIAGGIKDVKLGDVVAGTKVYGYESGKVNQTFQPRPDVGLSTYNMIQRAKAEARKDDWLVRLESTTQTPQVFVAPIAAGEKVVADLKSDLFKFLQHNYGDALAVEMEGRGILQATHANQDVSALIIRGISDLIDRKSETDSQGYQEIASRHASAFAFEILAKLQLNNSPEYLTSQDIKIEKNMNQKYKLNLEETKKIQQILIEYFSSREKAGQHLKALITIGNLNLDVSSIDYNLPVRELVPSFYAQIINKYDDYLSFLQTFKQHLPPNSDEQIFVDRIIKNIEEFSEEEWSQKKNLVNEINSANIAELKNNQQKKPNFFAYDEVWVGRDNLISDLTNKIQGSCRLLVLVGITGIGKTALGEKLANDLQPWFGDWNHYLQENFDNQEQTSDFGSVAARLLEKAGEVVTPDDRKDTERLIYRLVRHLQQNRYLIQIDSIENILEGNEEEGWSDFKDEWWLKFFTTWLSDTNNCESCFVLTSQDLPAQIPTLATKSQNFWYCQALSGLEDKEQLALFAKTGLDVGEEADGKPYLERIGKAYEGHPLALRVIAGEIVNRPYDGNVVAYWNKYGQEVEEVERAIEEAKEKGITASADDQYNLHRYTRSLRRNVKVRLEKAFDRLHEQVKAGYLLLCESSVYRCEVPEDFWLSHLEDWDIDEDGQQIALDALRDRYLVEERIDDNHQYVLRQHNLIRSLSLERLRGLDEEDESES